MSWFRRRPKAKPLAALYDEGVAAARTGAPDPYQPPEKPGDATRSALWRFGKEDESEFIEMKKLT